MTQKQIDKEDRYMNACIKYLQKNMECTGYRDYIIERLNKYQKIEEIIADWWSDGGAFEMLESYWLRLISEVIEDGNDD